MPKPRGTINVVITIDPGRKQATMRFSSDAGLKLADRVREFSPSELRRYRFNEKLGRVLGAIAIHQEVTLIRLEPEAIGFSYAGQLPAGAFGMALGLFHQLIAPQYLMHISWPSTPNPWTLAAKGHAIEMLHRYDAGKWTTGASLRIAEATPSPPSMRRAKRR
jgi:hypothetical protein